MILGELRVRDCEGKEIREDDVGIRYYMKNHMNSRF